MIAAGLVLLAVGVVDIVRGAVRPARASWWWVPLAAAGLGVLILGLVVGALAGALLAIAVATGWVWLVPAAGRSHAGFWPAVALALVCATAMASAGARAEAGLLGAWRLPTPVGELTLDHVVLVGGAVAFLVESANAVVRVALAGEGVPGGGADAAGGAPASTTAEAAPALKGGRLIGPLERLIVFALTLAAAYPLLAAFIAAKGIVRFPEISRDSGLGNRAEYFLIGSLVSWAQALAAAFLVWWAYGSVTG